jgi:hypothetical protein
VKSSTRQGAWRFFALTAVTLALAGSFRSPAAAQNEPGASSAPEQITRPKVAAKPPPVNVVAEVGIDNCYRPGRITPVKVTLDNNGDGIEGRLSLTPTNGEKGTEMAIDLPRRGHKVYTLFSRLSGSGKGSYESAAWELRLWDRHTGGRALVREKLEPIQVDKAAFVLSCTGDGSGLQFLHDQENYRVKHLSPTEMPRQWPGYEPADIVAVNGRAWQEMDEEQRTALRVWLDQGGHAVLCGESPTEWRDAEAAGLIGCAPKDLGSLPRLDCVTAWAGQPYLASSGKLMTVSGPLRPGAEKLLIEGTRALVIGRPTVKGRVVWVGFDPFSQTIRNWRGNKALWRRLLQEARSGKPASKTELQASQPTLASATTALPRLPAPPHWALVVFAACYALIFGPINILILRRLRRSVRAWFFMPGLAFGMLVIVLAGGQAWGQARVVLNEVTLLETRIGSRSAWETGLLGVFSPTNRSFAVRIEDPAPSVESLIPASSRDVEGGNKEMGWPDEQLDGSVRWSSLPMQLFSIAWLPVSRPRDLAGSLEWTQTSDKRLALRNGTALRLRNTYLKRRNVRSEYLWLGTVDPGATVALGGKWSESLKSREEPNNRSLRQLENRRFQEGFNKAWQEIGAGEAFADKILLVSETDPGQGVELEGMTYTNRASLLVAVSDDDPTAVVRLARRSP